jgi:uncharacterized protein YndB with AHSA1/START domain
MDPMTHALKFQHTVHASRPIVCHAWTDAEQLKVWYKPDDSWSTPVAEIDLRAGGKYRIGLKPPFGSTFFEVGEYQDVALPDRLVYTLRFEGTHLQFAGAHLDEPTGSEMEKYETVITVEFQELPSGWTRVVGTHGGYRNEEDRDRHQNGWPRFLEQLARYCESQSRLSQGR